MKLEIINLHEIIAWQETCNIYQKIILNYQFNHDKGRKNEKCYKNNGVFCTNEAQVTALLQIVCW